MNSPSPELHRACGAVAVIAAVFAAVVAGVLVRQLAGGRALAIAESDQLAASKRQLLENPQDERIKQRIRQIDLRLRRRHMEKMRLAASGGWLILIGSAVGLAAWQGRRWTDPIRPARPEPIGRDDRRRRQVNRATLAVSAVGVLLGLGAAWLARPAPAVAPPEPVADGPVLDVNWPRFRGPGGTGRTQVEIPLPQGPDDPTILWKAPLALPGKNSPVAMGNVIYLAAASENRRTILGFAAGSGRELFATDIPATPASPTQPPEILADTGFAAATMAVVDDQAVAIFANGDLAAVDPSGTLLWTRSLGLPHNQYGLASSLVPLGQAVLVPFDQTLAYIDGAPQPRSQLMAIDPASGSELWAVARDVPDSWTTPIVIDHAGGRQIITAAAPWVIAYSPTGDELWRIECLTGDVAPSPVFAAGRVFVTMQGAGLAAIEPGSADAPARIAWRNTDGPFPDIISPLATERYVLTLTTPGLLRCFEAASGKQLWQHDLAEPHYASPALLGPAGSHVLLVAESGRLRVIALGESYEEIATGTLGEPCYTTPAFGGGRMFIRGANHLMCIGQPEPTGEPQP